jgi:hypothetical protein
LGRFGHFPGNSRTDSGTDFHGGECNSRTKFQRGNVRSCCMLGPCLMA